MSPSVGFCRSGMNDGTSARPPSRRCPITTPLRPDPNDSKTGRAEEAGEDVQV